MPTLRQDVFEASLQGSDSELGEAPLAIVVRSSSAAGKRSLMEAALTIQFDGFGNLTAKVLNGTTTPISVNAATNQLTNAYYDANGNMTSGAGASFTFDASNRIATASGIERR